MPSTSNISTPQIGMNSDLLDFNKNGQMFSFALNADLEDSDGKGYALQNSKSNRLAVNFPNGTKVIGKVEIQEQNRVLYMLVASGTSEIGEVQNCNFNDDSDDVDGIYECDTCIHSEQRLDTPLEKTTQTPYCSYNTITSASCLNFSIDHPVLIEYRITDCGINIYFTDKFNERRFMYFTYTDGDIRKSLILDNRFKIITGFTGDDCPQPIYEDALDCNKINYNPIHTIPCVSSIEEITGGSLLAGVYQAIIAYSDAEGNPISEYGAATQPFSIFTKFITVDTNYPTDKAIEITINGIDTNTLFGYYNLVIAETIDNFTTFKLAGTFPVTKNKIVYTGNDKTLITLTAEDVLFKRPFYQTAGSITKANNFLFFADVAEFNKPNLQPIASSIIVYWQTVAIPEAVYFKPDNGWRYRSLMRDEVYPLGLVPITDNGEEFCVIHIPGRVATEDDLEIISNNDVLEDTGCTDITRTARWQVYNTASASGTTQHEITVDCEDTKCWETGTMAYWESTDTYPNDPLVWGDLCNQPIRHHKMPDSCVTHIHDNLGGNAPYATSNLVFPLGIKIDHQSVIDAFDLAVTNGYITQADRDRITGYRIVRGNRVGNKSVVAKGLLFDMWSYDKFNQRWYYANYPYNDLQNDNLISNDEDTYDEGNESSPIPNVFTKTSRYTFHSPDTHFVNPTLGDELHLETEEYGQSEGYFNLCDEEAKFKLLSTFAAAFTFAAGIAAGFSATGDKQCVTYTTQSQTLTTTSMTGDTPVGVVTGSSPGATATVITPAPFTATGTSTSNYNFTPFIPYGQQSGSQIGQVPVLVETITKTTCTGNTWQNLSPLNLDFLAFGLASLVNQSIYRVMLGLNEMNIMKNLIMSLLPLKNFAIQYNSIGKYNNYKCVATDEGNKVRKILKSAYLTPENQVINEDFAASGGTSIFVNNWERESSVYIKTDNSIPFPNPTVTDNSRGSMDDFGLDYGDLNKRVYRDISSYYASIKNFVPDQYGSIYGIDYLETNGCVFDLATDYDDCSHVFGGDVFINRFALKIKLPFFLQSRFRAGDDSDVKYSELGNVGYPNYYFNNDETLLEKIEDEGLFTAIFNLRDLVGAPRSRLDAKTDSQLFFQKGYIHLYNYGIPYFLVESDVNVDYRHGEDNKAHDFYPHQTNLDFWLQKKNVDIAEDNYYTYNKTYSKQNHESIICVNQATFDTRACKVTHPNRVIYFDETNASKFGDNWIISKANNFYDFPLSLGKLISVDGIENEKVLVRFENGMQIFNAYDTLKTGAGINIQLGTGGVFASRPEEFSKTTLGYGGSQHRAIEHTEYGHITVDAKRGNIFNILPNASGLDELSKEGKRNWFKENLPFTLLKQFPALEDDFLDNTFKGVGLTMAFDKRFNRFFLTKLDYKSINPNITWVSDLHLFAIDEEEVSLTDTRYFCNKSWTISYNFFTKTWIYHSFTPNYYVDHVGYFQAGLNDNTQSSVWSHGVTNKSYQVYFGTLYPFIIETLSEKTVGQNFVKYINFDLEVLRYHNEFDWATVRNITFNKAIVFNQRQCSGLLELIVKNEENLEDTGRYPEITPNSIKIDITNSNNTWNFNQFYDNVNSQISNVPIWLNDCANVNRRLNPKAFDFYSGEDNNALIKGQQTQIRLINDKESNYKFIFKFNITNQNQSIR